MASGVLAQQALAQTHLRGLLSPALRSPLGFFPGEEVAEGCAAAPSTSTGGEMGLVRASQGSAGGGRHRETTPGWEMGWPKRIWGSRWAPRRASSAPLLYKHPCNFGFTTTEGRQLPEQRDPKTPCRHLPSHGCASGLR